MNLTVIWRLLLGACQLIRLSVCEGQNCNNYSGNTRLNLKQLSRPGAPVFHRRFSICNCGPRFRKVPVVPTFLSALNMILKSSQFFFFSFLTFRHRPSSIQDRRFATVQRTLFIYLINKCISLSDIYLTVHH